MRRARVYSKAILCLALGVIALLCSSCNLIDDIINTNTPTPYETAAPTPADVTPTPYPHTTTKLVDSEKLLAVIFESIRDDFDFESVDDSFCAYIFNRPFLSQIAKEKPEYSVIAAGIYTAIITSQKEYKIPDAYSIHKDDILRIVFFLKNECPELFHMDKSYSYLSDSNDIVKSLKFQYRMSPFDYYEALKRTYETIQVWSEAVATKSEYERELALYNEIMANCIYSLNADFRDSAYGAIVLGKALCEGYSHAFMMAMHYNGIVATQLTGNAFNSENGEEEPHAWNIVYINGEPYQTDPTWDDFDDSHTSRSRYTYFNITDDEMMHKRTLDDRFATVEVPKCTATEYNYFIVNDLFVEEGTDIKALLFDKLSALNVNEGEKGKSIQLKFESKEDYELFNEKHADWVKEWNKESARIFGISGFSYYTSDDLLVVSYAYRFGKK